MKSGPSVSSSQKEKLETLAIYATIGVTLSRSFKEVFSEKDAQAKAQAKLMHIRQGNRSADEYKLEFERYQADAKFDKVTLTMYFKEGLQNWLYDRICDIENPPDDEDLEKWKKKACKFDRNNRQKREFKQGMISYRTPSSSTQNQTFRPCFVPRIAPQVPSPSRTTSCS